MIKKDFENKIFNKKFIGTTIGEYIKVEGSVTVYFGGFKLQNFLYILDLSYK